MDRLDDRDGACQDSSAAGPRSTDGVYGGKGAARGGVSRVGETARCGARGSGSGRGSPPPSSRRSKGNCRYVEARAISPSSQKKKPPTEGRVANGFTIRKTIPDCAQYTRARAQSPPALFRPLA